MGTILSFKHGENSVSKVDNRLWDIVQNAIAAVPYDAQIRSGSERGPGDKGNHSKGYAVDVTLIDPKTGRVIPDTGKYGGVDSAKIYEQYAQAARVYQQEKYPELNSTFRWGGGFRQGGTPFDLMHLDITPKARGAMAYYNWETGFNANAEAALPGIRAATSGGLGGANGARLASQYRQALSGSGGLVPPGVLGDEAPIPASLTRGIDIARTKFAANIANTPLPRPRPDTTSANAPIPATMSPALQAARARLATARGVTPAASTSSRAADPLGVGVAGLSVTPRLPIADYTKPVIFTPEQQKAAAAASPKTDQTNAQARAAALDKGMGSALSPKPINPATPNPAKPPVTGLKVPTGATVDPIGSGAALTMNDIAKFAGQPVSGRWDTGQGVAGTVQMPLDARPSILPPASPTITLPTKQPASGASLAAPGAGLSAAQRNAMTSLAGTGMGNVIPPVPETMPAGLRSTAAPKANPITVSKPTPAVQTQPKLYQSGGYVYVANPSGGYTKVGKVGQGSYSTSSTTTKTATSAPASSSSSSSGSIPKGYIDLGNGKIQSPETGGIYYTRNL